MVNYKTVLGLALAAVAGAGLALLFAPDKGLKTRKKIADMANNYAGSAKDNIGHFFSEMMGKTNSTKVQAEKIVHRKNQSDQSNLVIKSLRFSAIKIQHC